MKCSLGPCSDPASVPRPSTGPGTRIRRLFVVEALRRNPSPANDNWVRRKPGLAQRALWFAPAAALALIAALTV
ncbi:MAG: hypothetical protein ACFB6R_11395 [Alphaproteobacteria bacterium]